MKARRLYTLLWVLSCVMMSTFALLTVTPSESASIGLAKHRVNGAYLHVISANLNDPRVRVDIGLSAKGIPHSEPFLSMVRRHAPAAAVTGTYFDTRTLYPVGSIIQKGRTNYESAIGTAVCFVRNDSMTCISVAGPATASPQASVVRFASTKRGEKFNWNGVDAGIRTGPRLLAHGAYALNPRREGFRHPGLFGSRTRIALGTTPGNKLLLVAVTTPVTFGRLAGIMKALGATDAVALDGGTSSAMYYRGRLLHKPGRALTNIIEVFETDLTQPAVQMAMVEQRATIISRLLDYVASTTRINITSNAKGLEQSSRNIHQPLNSNMLISYEQYAQQTEITSLRTAKGRHAIFPVYRTKLTRLQCHNDSQNLVHVSTNSKVMHHLVT